MDENLRKRADEVYAAVRQLNEAMKAAADAGITCAIDLIPARTLGSGAFYKLVSVDCTVRI